MHPLKYKRKKEKEKREALKLMRAYFKEAQGVFDGDKDKANRLVRKIRRLAMKHRIKLPITIKRSICKHCYSFLVPGKNLRVRTRKKHRQVVYYCLECKRFMKFGYGEN